MIGGLIEGVQFAAGIGEATIGNNDIQQPSTFTHWSEYCLMTGALLATISSVALIILGMYALAIVCCALAVISFIGVYYLKQFAPLHELEGTVNILQQKTRQLFRERQALEQANIKLDETIGKIDIEKKAEEERRIKNDIETKTQLSMLSAQVQSLQKSLSASEEERTKLKERQNELQNQSNKTTTLVQQSIASNTELGQSLDRVSKDAKDLAASSHGLEKAITILDADKASECQETGRVAELLEKLAVQRKESALAIENANEKISVLEKQIKQLSIVSDSFKAGAQQIDGAAAIVKEQSKKMDELISHEIQANQQAHTFDERLAQLLVGAVKQ